MIMGLAIFWLLCAAAFLELAARAPEVAEPEIALDLGTLHLAVAQPMGVATEALSLKTAASDRSSP
ncbi:conserved hypothetical protein [Hyphomicrobiales bacterium]|nr:conserved hypothetical protein [Hyphomicrobiales bacterium]CAH1701971.1 conserved hypothetical protein [Hyphomicrobiales bacterium]